MIDIKQHVSKVGRKLSQQTQSLINRSADRHVRLAVTGLSGAGKTAFITGLVNLLYQAGAGDSLTPLWRVNREGRLFGVKRELQPDLNIARFDHQAAIAALTQTPPQWPESTKSISELRLAIRYQPKEGLLAKLSDHATLYLDIIDYPGEWLLDLPMLSLDYQQWSLTQKEQQKQFSCSELYEGFYRAVEQLELAAPVDEAQLSHIGELYRKLLLDCVENHGFYYAQPGRLLLPGELEGTPLLSFFPLLNVDEAQWKQLITSDKQSNFQVLNHRYQQYCAQVITPFYDEHFTKFDRQVVLVDCLSALNGGQAQFNDMAKAINAVLESFKFGQSNLLQRLFSPKIDRLLFAASKADHVTRDQQSNLLKLLSNLVFDSQQHARFEGTEVEVMAISAIRATKQCLIEHEGRSVPVITGIERDSQNQVTIYPGDVPTRLPSNYFWQNNRFNFTSFAPPELPQQISYLSSDHIRLDHLLEFLIGDKLA